MSYLYVKWNSFWWVRLPIVERLEHILASLTTRGTKACDAASGVQAAVQGVVRPSNSWLSDKHPLRFSEPLRGCGNASSFRRCAEMPWQSKKVPGHFTS
jgi:hypothetical protein